MSTCDRYMGIEVASEQRILAPAVLQGSPIFGRNVRRLFVRYIERNINYRRLPIKTRSWLLPVLPTEILKLCIHTEADQFSEFRFIQEIRFGFCSVPMRGWCPILHVLLLPRGHRKRREPGWDLFQLFLFFKFFYYSRIMLIFISCWEFTSCSIRTNSGRLILSARNPGVLQLKQPPYCSSLRHVLFATFKHFKNLLRVTEAFCAKRELYLLHGPGIHLNFIFLWLITSCAASSYRTAMTVTSL